MSKARLVITALVVEQQTVAEVAARYGVHRSWVYRLKARYDDDGEAAFEPRSRRPHDLPGRDRGQHRRADPPAAQGTHRGRPGRRPGHHRLAPEPPPPGHGVGIDHQPDPDPRRPGHPRAEEATEVLLHPVRGRDAQRVLAVRLHPLPPHPARRPTRRRRRDHQLARRLHPLRPARHRPPTGSPARSCWPPSAKPQTSTDPGIHADRQRHGLHRPLRRRPRRPQRLRARAPPPGTSSRRTPAPTTPPPAARSNASSRP